MLNQTVLDTLRTQLINSQWVHPLEDKHYTVTGGRITRLAGRNRPISIGYEELAFPSYGKIYHLFQIGPYVSEFFNTPIETRTWISFKYVLENYKNFLQAFDVNGVVLDATTCWIWIHDNGTIYVAVEDNDRIVTDQNIYFRFFSPFWMQKNDRDFEYLRQLVLSDNDLIYLQDYVETHNEHAIIYVNGHYSPHITPLNVSNNDVVEIVFDPSIKDFIDFNIDELNVFESLKDSTMKYILHPPKDEDGMRVHYRDDLDLYLYRKLADKDTWVVGKGRYLPRTGRDSLRMLTHRDYSVRSDDVNYLSSLDSEISNAKYIRLYRRNSVTERYIRSDGARLFDLYRLDDQGIVGSFIGARSYYEGWKAANLESWPFIEYVSSRDFNKPFNPLLVMGYQGVVDGCYDAVRYVREESGFFHIDIPEGYRSEGAVCYLYDKDNLLVDRYQVTDEMLITVGDNIAYGEFIAGKESGHIPVLGTDAVEMDQHKRAYRALYPNGKFVEQWSDVTGNLGTWSDFDGVYWDIDHIEEIVQVKDARNIVNIEKTLNKTDGYYAVDLKETALLKGELVEIPIYIGFRNIDVFLNGRTLVWGEGYVIYKQKLFILDHELIADDNRVLVRLWGLPEGNGIGWIPPKEVGYIDGGMLSKDARYDLIDEQTTRISIDGVLRERANIAIEEENNVDLSLNGRPYELRDYAQPLHGLAEDPYTPYLEYRTERDAIEDQLHIMHKADYQPVNDTIPSRYTVYSPLLSKLLYDSRTGGIDLDLVRGTYDDRLILDWVGENRDVYEVDPYRTKQNLKWKVSRPIASYESTAVDWYEYRLLRRANDLLFEGLYNLETTLHMVEADV